MCNRLKTIVSALLVSGMFFSATDFSAFAEPISGIIKAVELIQEEIPTEEAIPEVEEVEDEEVFAFEKDEESFEGKVDEDGLISNSEILTKNTAPIEESEISLMSVEYMGEGLGTKEEPFLIYTEEEFIEFAVGNVTDGLSAYWSLESDIVLTADTCAPIGAYTPFTGVFDGKGHTISGTELFQSTAMSGLFGYNAGVIKNLKVDVTAGDIATDAGILCATNNGTIENCHVTGEITTSANKNIGGLVAVNDKGTIINCSSSVVITAPNATVGGLVGYNKNATIKYSWTYNKTMDEENEEEELLYGNTVGGLVGYVYNDNANIESMISNCYTLGKIKGGNRVGGLIGYCDIGTNKYATEWYGYITVEYCYAKGVITAGSTKGGLIGGLNSTDKVGIRHSYFNNINNYNKYGYAVSLMDIKKKNTFYDWNFEEVWAIDSEKNAGYPYIDYKGYDSVVIDGEGTVESPYIITNEKQLCYLASEKLPLNAHYKLANDIKVVANYWTPIAAARDVYFSGIFDGNGYAITGVHTENIYYGDMGLFGRNSGTIKNLTVEGWFNGNGTVGCLTGYNIGAIENCNSYTENSEYYISGTSYVGGLVGNNTNGVIEKSHSSCIVTAYGASAGGLVGYLGNGKIKYSYAMGSVTGYDAGGLIGYIYNDVSNRTTTIISNCYAMGKITGASSVGGLIGYCDIGTNKYATEWYGYITVEYCYARGTANAGLVGNIDNADRVVIRYCYYNIANTGNNIGFGVKVSELKLQDTFYGWDFDNIWKIEKGINTGYPHIDIRGEIPVNKFVGNGEEDRPYLIYDEEDLRSLVADVYGPYDLTVKHFYKLMNDIEVTANFWTPIGANGVNCFNGIFDGDGHTISGIKLSNSHYTRSGLFGVNTGTIKNLTVEADISGECVGAICGENQGTIENCSSGGTLVIDSNDTERYAGGITGYNNCGTITKSNSSAIVTSSGWEAGGITGRSRNGTISYCHTNADVSGRFAGGITGRLYNDNTGTTTSIDYSYAVGIVNGSEYSGGLVGVCDIATNKYVTDWYGYTCIENSYSTSIAEGNGNKGGLIGGHDNIERNYVRYSYYNSFNTGNTSGFSATLGQMKDKSLYYMWDFDNIWRIDPDVNGGYPYLDVRGTTKAHYLEGYGDEEDPYMIEDEEDLWTLVMDTYDLNANYYYQLQNDIELTAEHWTPIGGKWDQVSFNGIFDGNGYTISGLKIYNSDLVDCALFGNNTGTIKNLNVEGNVSGEKYVGLICGNNKGIIDNCSSSGTVSAFTTGEAVYTGGLVGYNKGGTILNSHSTATVKGINGDTGGLVGRNYNARIEKCYATGNVLGKYIGGLVGRQYNDDASTTTTIKNSFATGAVVGSADAGGLVGVSDIATNKYVTDWYGYTHIENSYSTGKVEGTAIGGLVGYSNNSVRNSILSSYYNQTNTGLSDIDRGTPLEDASMKLQSSYVGWDFADTWSINGSINNGYPTLSGQDIQEIVPVTGVTLTPASITVGTGRSATLTAQVAPDNASNKELIWKSSNERIVTVADGVVTGLLVGDAVITVTTWDGEFTAQCEVSVTNMTIPVSGISLDKTEITVLKGETATLSATVNPSGATDKSVAWSSDNTKVATVSNGVVTAVSSGTAVITATTADGGYTASCTVTVNALAETEGKCGDNVTWKYENGILTITGYGAIYDYSSDNDYTTNPPPWFEFRDEIKDIVISEGITRIGDFALVGCVNLTEMTLPSTLESIGERAFMDWISLVEIEIPKNVTTIEDGAFEWNDNFEKVTIYENVTNFGEGVFTACGKLTMYGISGSDAESYANTNKIPFVSIGDIPDDVTIGDANGDGDIDFTDAIVVLKHDAGISTLTGDKLTAADVNGDGDVDFVDAIQILKYDSGLISSFN